jgi:DNA-binding CsgD family transcriptional regulator
MLVWSRAWRVLPAVLGVLFVIAWVLTYQSQFTAEVPLRMDTFATNPYAFAIVIGFAVACAIVPWVPHYALGLTAVLLGLQFAFWPTRFSQIGWTGYFLLVVLAFGLAAFTADRGRRWTFAGAILLGLAVAALLNLPSLSLSGQWGTINGKDWVSSELWLGLLAWSIVITIGVLLCWRAGGLVQRAEHPSDVADTIVADRSELLSLLTPREYQIFALVGQGMTNAEIAGTAHISVATVKTHLSHILVKTGSSSRAHLIALAHRDDHVESSGGRI